MTDAQGVRAALEEAGQYILSLTYGLEENTRRKAMLDKIDAELATPPAVSGEVKSKDPK